MAGVKNVSLKGKEWGHVRKDRVHCDVLTELNHAPLSR